MNKKFIKLLIYTRCKLNKIEINPHETKIYRNKHNRINMYNTVVTEAVQNRKLA